MSAGNAPLTVEEAVERMRKRRCRPLRQIPTSSGHELRACLGCRLVKTYDQFRNAGCENCPFLQMDGDLNC